MLDCIKMLYQVGEAKNYFSTSGVRNYYVNKLNPFTGEIFHIEYDHLSQVASFINERVWPFNLSLKRLNPKDRQNLEDMLK